MNLNGDHFNTASLSFYIIHHLKLSNSICYLNSLDMKLPKLFNFQA